MANPRRLKKIGEAVRRGTDSRDLATAFPPPAGVDYAYQNQAYFGRSNGPINAESLGAMEQIAAANGGGSGFLPSPLPIGGLANLFNTGALMANVKATFEFLGVNGANWSEDWWTPLTNVDAALPTPTQIIATRLAILSSANKLLRVRYVQDDASRLTQLEDVFKGGTRKPGTTGLAPASLAAVFTLRAANGASRKWWLRGINDNDWAIGAEGKQILGDGMSKAVAAFVDALESNSWGVRTLNRVALRPPNVVFVVSVDGKTIPGVSTITTAGPHGFINGDEVIFYRQNEKDLPGLRGHWRVIAPPATATTFQIAYRTALDGGPLPGTGFVRKAVYNGVQRFLKPNTNGSPPQPKLLHIAHHDTKDEVFGSRGSRRASRLRQSR